MPAYQPCTLTLDAVQEYFAQLNPLAHRIACDIKDTQSTYGQLWSALNPNEQNDIINETLIKPEISLKYFDNFSTTSVATTSLSSSCSLTSASPTPSNCSANSAARMLQLGTTSTQPKCTATNNASVESLTTEVLKSAPSLLHKLPVTTTQQATLQPLTKLKPPSEPPPPPPNTATILAEQRCAKSKAREIKSKCSADNKNYYAYDGRNLRTYVQQKVALKTINDDTLGMYRDEHSWPFSYRTKSQINLQQILSNTTALGSAAPADDEMCLLHTGSNKRYAETAQTQSEIAVINNYKKLQTELKKNLNSQLEKSKHSSNSSTANYQWFDNPAAKVTLESTQNNNDNNKTKLNSVHSTANAQTNRNKNSSKVNCKSDGLLLNFNNAHSISVSNTTGSNSPKNLSYAVYTDTYYDHCESANLMQNSGILTASSSSATTSDDDERNNYDDDDDEKTLCEDVKLLDNDINLRKGFDFLNNW